MVYRGRVHGFIYFAIGPIAVWVRPLSNRTTAWNSHHSPLRFITRWVSISKRYRAIEN